MDKEKLVAAGIDVDAALGRLMGSEALLVKLLGKFVQETTCERLVAAVEAGDNDGAYDAAHALKGVAGNLSMTELYRLTSEFCEKARADAWADACALVPAIASCRDALAEAIPPAL